MQSWVSARGLTGRIYRYLPLGRWDDWLNVPANYGFGYLTGGLAPYWHILYFGEVVNIRDRMLGHERWLEAFNLGATHVLAHVSSPDEVVRRAEERDLIQSHNPVLNVQHRTTNALADLLCSNPLGLGSLGSALGFGLGSPWPSGKL